MINILLCRYQAGVVMFREVYGRRVMCIAYIQSPTTNMKRTALILIILSFILACAGPESSEEKDARTLSVSEARDIGKKVSAVAGATLVSQLGRAIAEQDAAYAIRFCNLSASEIVDSINRANNCTVQRLTTRRRNPSNRIETAWDKIAWNSFRTSDPDAKRPDTVLVARGVPVYYQPIFIKSELCLQCHGSRSTDIELATLEAIDSLYPADAAVNYVLGDLRGMWKISFDGNGE